MALLGILLLVAGVGSGISLRRVRDAHNAARFDALPRAPPRRLHAAPRPPRAAPFCRPGDACWPSAAEWSALNATVDGRLLTVRPEGSPCVDDSSSPACAAVQANWDDPVWRAAQAGAMQRPQWEADRTTGANCYTLGSACAQGDVPPFAVAAASTADVAAALSFAGAHNLRVAVKSSGHEIQGRSTAPDALLVWTHGLKAGSIAVDPAFRACPGDAPALAVTIGPGNSYGAVYAALDPAFTIVGGSARTVSAAGGHVLSGGHSFVSPHYGLAADNLLAAEAVLANGSIVRASACENADLFWALRGGGGGTFAVVTSATHRAHLTPPAVTGVILVVALQQGLASVQKWLYGALALTPALTDSARNAGNGVFGGYHNTLPADGHPGVFVWEAIFGFNGTTTDANASLAGFYALIASEPAHFSVAQLTVEAFPSWEAWHSSFDPPASGDPTGSPSTIGCRFVPLSSATDSELRFNASVALTAVAQYVPLLGHLVVGGAVSQLDPGSTSTSVTPAWRSALWHMCVGIGWSLNATIAEQDDIAATVSELTGMWRDAFPDSGAYWGESDLLEPDWQQSFFGRCYPRLQQIKNDVDPTGRFDCHHCVELPSRV